MLDEVIRELTAKDNNKQTTSKDVLAWTKRVEVQQAQAAILNNITESQKFDKIKMAQKPKSSWDKETTHPMHQKQMEDRKHMLLQRLYKQGCGCNYQQDTMVKMTKTIKQVN